MARKVGRPLKEITKNKTIGIRLSGEMIERLQKCSDELKIPRTHVIEKGILLVEKEIEDKK